MESFNETSESADYEEVSAASETPETNEPNPEAVEQDDQELNIDETDSEAPLSEDTESNEPTEELNSDTTENFPENTESSDSDVESAETESSSEGDNADALQTQEDLDSTPLNEEEKPWEDSDNLETGAPEETFSPDTTEDPNTAEDLTSQENLDNEIQDDKLRSSENELTEEPVNQENPDENAEDKPDDGDDTTEAHEQKDPVTVNELNENDNEGAGGDLPKNQPDDITQDPYYTEEDLNAPRDYDNADPNREYTDDDIRQLEQEDPGYINGDVLDYDHPDYLKDGTHRVNWGNDSADTPHQETLEPGTRLSRVGSEDGRYLGDPDINYDDRQLPVEEGKLPEREYEVVKPLEVEQSTIAQQPWGREMENPNVQQYKTDKPVSQLVDEGYLREVPEEEPNMAMGSLNEKQVAAPAKEALDGDTLSDISSTGGPEHTTKETGNAVESPKDNTESQNLDKPAFGQNFNPRQDVESAFDYADQNYPRSSPHWQEAANRQMDNLSAEKQDLDMLTDRAKTNMDDKYAQLSDYIRDNNLTSETACSDPGYISRVDDYNNAKAAYDDLSRERDLCQAKIDDISANLDPEKRTTFKGMDGADFDRSYDPFITEQQGNAVPGVEGCCGINEACNMVNQQTGSSLGEADGIKAFTEKGLCETGNIPEKNGGTYAVNREEFLNSQDLDFDDGNGKFGKQLSLDDVADRFYNGESAGVILKAEDLSQPELADRKFHFSNTFEQNKCRKDANHATTVAGFSYYDNGDIAGVWLNDTGYFAGNNRVFVDVDKFSQMQKNTNGFSVEFAAKR